MIYTSRIRPMNEGEADVEAATLQGLNFITVEEDEDEITGAESAVCAEKILRNEGLVSWGWEERGREYE